MTNFFLGYEGGRQTGVDDENVDPGNMIGDQHGTGKRAVQIGLDLDTESIK